MSLNAGASQRAQGRSPGLGGRGTHRRGAAPGLLQAPWPAGHKPASRLQEAGGRWPLSRTATRIKIRCGRFASGAWLPLVLHTCSGRTSDCGSTSVGIVYAAAALVLN